MPPGNWRLGGWIAVGFAIFLAARATAQQPTTPHIGYVYPAGGRQGTSFQVTVGGQLLDGVGHAWISGRGAQGTVLVLTKPLTAKQANALREQFKALQQKRLQAARRRWRRTPPSSGGTNVLWTAADEKALMEIRKKLATFQRRPANPAIAEKVTIQIQLAPDAEPGEHELRLETRLGLSNPLVFCVGQLPEYRKSLSAQAGALPRFRRVRNNREPRATPPTDTRVTLPAVLNGQILPGGVDRFHFQGRKGQRLVVAAHARELIPYLADAVPGWFQAALTLYDAHGKELAYADHYLFHPDPVLLYELPQDGEYILEIRDSIYRGREDFVYRITAGELPFLTGIFPLGGPVGDAVQMELNGWNLPVHQLALREDQPGVYAATIATPGGGSASLPFVVDTLPECVEQEPNDDTPTAQAVTLPIIVNGHINRPGDCDVFRFEGQAGQAVVAEVEARRLDSPLDSFLEITDAYGRRLGFNDDHEDKGCGLLTHQADSYLRLTLPTNGLYYVRLRDTQEQGGPEFAYRLRLSSPRPDFALRVVPSSINVRGGMSAPLTVYALRRDGFTNQIRLRLKDAPAGFTLAGAVVPANADEVRLTLSAPGEREEAPWALSVEGRAQLDGKEIVHEAVPADDQMQAFAYHQLVPAKELRVAVVGNRQFVARNWLRWLDTTPIRIPAGGSARLHLRAPGRAFAQRFELELSDPPDGIALGEVTPSPQGAELLLKADGAKVRAGLNGNLIVDVLPGKAVARGQKSKRPATNRRSALASLPAIPFEVVAPETE